MNKEERIALSIAEVAEACGVSKKTIFRQIQTGRLRATRIASRVLVRREDIDRWLEAAAQCQ